MRLHISHHGNNGFRYFVAFFTVFMMCTLHVLAKGAATALLTTADFNFLKMMLNRLTLTSSTLRPQSVEAKAEIARGLEENVWPLLNNGTVAPVMFADFPLEKASEAHALMETSTHIGKIVLNV